MSQLTDWQLKWYPIATLLVLLATFLIFVLSADGARAIQGKLGGDFFAFYGAGRIVAEGDVGQLYSESRQIEAQNSVYSSAETYMCFAYPPFVTLPYAALSYFPYKIAYLLHTCLMLGALAVVLKVLFHKYDVNPKYFICISTLSLFSYPIFRTIFGGQNTLLTLLLLCLAWLCVDSGRYALGGVSLGLILFKPQFALPMIGLMFLARRWTVVFFSLLTAACLYIICYYMLGSDWMKEWIDFALWFAKKDAQINSFNSISWIGFLANLFGPKAFYAGLFLSIINAILLSVIWFRKGHSGSITALMPVTCISLALIPSRVIYYDSGLLLIACFAFVASNNKLGRITATLVWLCSFLQATALYLGFSPVSLVLIGSLIVAIVGLTQGDRERGVSTVT